MNETLSRGEKLTLLHFLRSLIGLYLTQDFSPITDREKWIKVNFSPRDKVSFTYFTGPKFIPPGTNSWPIKSQSFEISQSEAGLKSNSLKTFLCKIYCQVCHYRKVFSLNPLTPKISHDHYQYTRI